MSSISFQVPEPGIWTVTGEFGGQIVTQRINITDKGSSTPVALTFRSSTITVTSPVGTSLLLTDGTNQLTAISTGTNVFTIYNMGQWTVSGTLEGYTLNSVTVNVAAGQNYPVELEIKSATLTVTAPVGMLVSVVGGGDTQEIAATNGTAVFQITNLGSYQINGTLNGLNSNTVTVDVQEYRDYPLLLNYTFATITVATVAGTEITAQNGGIIITQTSNSNGEAVFEVATFGTWTVSSSFDGELVSANVEVSQAINYDVELLPTPQGEIYGAYWAGTSNPAWTRTDAAAGFSDPQPAVNNGTGSSPFDTIMPWAGMVKVEDEVAGTLVAIPKYWYKWTRDGVSMKLQVANYAADGFHISPAHADRGDGQGERDVVYVGRYHCGSDYKSTTGVLPIVNITRATARTSISNLGAEYWQYDYAMYWTIMILYLVEFANWNSQTMIGYGSSQNKALFNTGLTDYMQYCTGTSSASRTTYGCCQYRNIEGLWDNVYDWCDGIYFSGEEIFCIKNAANFSDEDSGISLGKRATSSNFISAWTTPSEDGFDYALYPNETIGSDSTFVCDYCQYNSTGTTLRIGSGYYNQSTTRGAFYVDGSINASYRSTETGCRGTKLPNV